MTDDKIRELAKAEYATDECEIDDNAKVARGEDGAFVAAWVWVSIYQDDSYDASTLPVETLQRWARQARADELRKRGFVVK